MRIFGLLLLSILHICYALTRAFQALAKHLNPRQRQARGVHSARRKTPAHIALVLAHGDAQKRHGQLSVEDVKAMLESVLHVAEWSQTVGVAKLTVYDREGQFTNHIYACLAQPFTGVLVSNASYLRRKLIPTQQLETTRNTLKPVKFDNYPLTPPLSDVSTETTEAESDVDDSINLGSTQFIVPATLPNDQTLHVNVISDKDGRTEVALCARQIAAFQQNQKNPLNSASLFKLDINTLDAVLEGGC
jgi:hypothetical protein